MTTRIITAAVGIPLLLLVIFLAPLWVFAIFAGLISAFASIEFIRSAGFKNKYWLYACAGFFSLSVSIGAAFETGELIAKAGLFLAIVTVFSALILSVRREKPLDMTTVCLAFFSCGLMPVFFSSMVRLGLNEPSGPFLLLPFVITMSSDSGAYFAGRLFGKNKLIPSVSPNKTLEGSTGGFLSAIILMLLYGLILMLFGYDVEFLLMAIYGFLGSFTAQLGDLAFSAVKRVNGIKDFGTLIPGHGGTLDRFDSMFFVAPLVEILVIWLAPFNI